MSVERNVADRSHLNRQPLVTVLTPVYNGEDYLAQCVESVIAQHHRRFEYIIVDNCSTDRTAEIAQSYARLDSRIRVESPGKFVSAIENHNFALSLVPADSEYVKIVSADDWIAPDCLEKMISLAEDHPTVGVVGAYQQSGARLKWEGLPKGTTVVSGREAARYGLLYGTHILGAPTSVLYRAALVRERSAFFPHLRAHADTSACYECLQHSDFGFVHEVLSAERVHQQQWSWTMHELGAGSVAYVDVLLRYGPVFLTPSEFAVRTDEVLGSYYRYLGGCALKLRGPRFWAFHRQQLNEAGSRLDWRRVAKGALQEFLTEATTPVSAGRKVLAVLQDKGLLPASRRN